MFRQLVILSLLFTAVSGETADQVFSDASLLSQKLNTLATDGLGVQEMQAYLSGLQFEEETVNGASMIQVLVNKLSQKFQARFAAVSNLKSAVESSYANIHGDKTTECCRVNKWDIEYDSRFRQSVKTTDMCCRNAESTTSDARELGSNVKDVMATNFINTPYLKWQYFGSDEGKTTIYPYHAVSESGCRSYDNRYRPWYIATATPTPKNVVMVIDVSGSMGSYYGGDSRMKLASEAAMTVLATLNPRDKVGVVAFSSTVSTPGSLDTSQCYDEHLAQATPSNIANLKTFVAGLQPGGFTMYGHALKSAFQMLTNSKPKLEQTSIKQVKQVILFLTDGQPTDSKETIMRDIVQYNTMLDNKVIIMTYGIGDDDFGFLDNMAKQEGFGHKWNATAGPIMVGKLIKITDVNKLRNEMATYYDFFSKEGQETHPIIAVPYFDAWGLGLITTVSLPCYHNNKFIGVVGIDITMSDLVADVTYFGPGKQSYAFMIDGSGLTMMHPLMKTPSSVHEDTFPIYVKHLEPAVAGNGIFESMQRGESGISTLATKLFLPRGGGKRSGTKLKDVNATYYWSPVLGTNFSVGLVVILDDVTSKLKPLKPHDDFHFVYHRLDLSPAQKACSQFKRYATKSASIIKYSPEAFIDPYMYIGLPETTSGVQKYAKYMHDRDDTVPNPGFREGVKDAVIASHMAEDIWMSHKTELIKYLVWRYVGSGRGTMRLFPGVELGKDYNPTKRPWYHGAVDSQGHNTLSTPYIDAFGAGVVITLSHTLYEGNHTDIFGVMGADFTLRYFHRLLTDTYPACKEVQNTCFVMDSSGFLVMHDDFLSPDITSDTLESVHITQKHSLVAQHMITKGVLVAKYCRDFAHLGRELFYEVHLETNQEFVLSADGCQKYKVYPVQNSNVYLGVIEGTNSACVPPPCECTIPKCTTSALTCKCPCASTLIYEYCNNNFPVNSDPVCPVPPAVITPTQMTENIEGIEKCYDPKCKTRTTFLDCYGVVGCSWCVEDEEGTPLMKPYCVDHYFCYGGQLGKRFPGSPTETPDTGWGERIKQGISEIIGKIAPGFGIVFLSGIYWWYRRKKKREQQRRENQSEIQPAPVPPGPSVTYGNYGGDAPSTAFVLPPPVPPYPTQTPYPSHYPPPSAPPYPTQTPYPSHYPPPPVYGNVPGLPQPPSYDDTNGTQGNTGGRSVYGVY